MKDKILNILKSIGIILLMLLFNSIFFLILNLMLNIDLATLTEEEYIFYLALSNITLIGIYIVIYKKILVNDLKDYIKNIKQYIIPSIKYWIIGFGIMILSNIIITFVLNKGIAGNEETVRSLIDSFPMFMIFNTVIYAPLTEELTFRKSIKDAINNKWTYILTSGLIFGMLHIISYINNWTDLIYLIPYSSLGIAFALLYYKTNNIYSTISMHAMHNLLAVIIYLIGGNI